MLEKLVRSFYTNVPIIRELIQVRRELTQLRQGMSHLTDVVRVSNAHNAVRMINEEMRNTQRYRDLLRLTPYEFRVSSQNGEDGIIDEIFKRITTTNRVFVEVGVGDGKENNTLFLISQGWTGYWLDGNDRFLCTQETQTGQIKSFVGLVTKENVGSLFAQLDVPNEFDLLSLDIDQNTYYAWEGLARFRPRVVVIEYNAFIPCNVDWKVNYSATRLWDGTRTFGASLKTLEMQGRRIGYCLVGCDFMGCNAFFVRDDVVKDRFAAPFTAENHYEPARHALSRWDDFALNFVATRPLIRRNLEDATLPCNLTGQQLSYDRSLPERGSDSGWNSR